MNWTLYVFVLISINGQPASLPTVIDGPVEFKTADACRARGKLFVSPQSAVICVKREAPAPAPQLRVTL